METVKCAHSVHFASIFGFIHQTNVYYDSLSPTIQMYVLDAVCVVISMTAFLSENKIWPS